MIGYLRGRVVERGDDGVLFDVSGVGYDLTCSLTTIDDLIAQDALNRDVQIWVQTYIREDAIALFGFATTLEKKMFLSLVKVNGVGPKMATKILSATTLDHLAGMIEAGDVKGLSGLPKVGKKTAEQLILSLKGKLVLASDEPKVAKKMVVPLPKFTGPRAEILSALVNLGFRLNDAERVVGDLPEEIELQTGVRQGLQALSGGF